jgi:hypothetical protein
MDELAEHLDTRAPCARHIATGETIVLHSCGVTWHFQPSRMRFRRVVAAPAGAHVFAGWLPYFGLEFEPGGEGFAVLLDPTGARTIRAGQHRAAGVRCADGAPDPAGDPSADRVLHLVA